MTYRRSWPVPPFDWPAARPQSARASQRRSTRSTGHLHTQPEAARTTRRSCHLCRRGGTLAVTAARRQIQKLRSTRRMPAGSREQGGKPSPACSLLVASLETLSADRAPLSGWRNLENGVVGPGAPRQRVRIGIGGVDRPARSGRARLGLVQRCPNRSKSTGGSSMSTVAGCRSSASARWSRCRWWWRCTGSRAAVLVDGGRAGAGRPGRAGGARPPRPGS